MAHQNGEHPPQNGEHPPSLEQLVEGVPEGLRDGVLAFLKAQGLESPAELAAVASEDLTQAFSNDPETYTLGHRVAIRRLCEIARLKVPPRTRRPMRWDSLKAIASPKRWLAPWAVRFVETVGAWQKRVPGLFISWKWIVLSGVLGALAETSDRWAHLTEWDTRCSHPPLPGNDTGIKYLIASSSQIGARSMSMSLSEAGVKSFQGVDFSLLTWSPLYDDWHMRPENGGKKGRYNKDHVMYRATGVSTKTLLPDIEVLMNLPPAEIASTVSRCRIDALSLTGYENLFWPIYRVSPNATVIYVHGSPHERPEAWEAEFHRKNFVWSMLLLILWATAPHMLPWSALLHVVDPLVGDQIKKRLEDGGPPLTEVWGPYIYLWYQSLQWRRAISHRAAGLRWMPTAAHAHHAFRQAVLREVPESRLKEWYLYENKWPELCELVNSTHCPWTDLLREQRHVPDFKFDDCATFWKVTALFVVLIWLNCQFLKYYFRVVLWVLSWRVFSPLRRIAKSLGGERILAGFRRLEPWLIGFYASTWFMYCLKRVILLSFHVTKDSVE